MPTSQLPWNGTLIRLAIGFCVCLASSSALCAAAADGSTSSSASAPSGSVGGNTFLVTPSLLNPTPADSSGRRQQWPSPVRKPPAGGGGHGHSARCHASPTAILCGQSAAERHQIRFADVVFSARARRLIAKCARDRRSQSVTWPIAQRNLTECSRLREDNAWSAARCFLSPARGAWPDAQASRTGGATRMNISLLYGQQAPGRRRGEAR